MASIQDLSDQLLGLFKASLQDAYNSFDPADKQQLVTYGKGIAQCVIGRRATTDPDEQAKLGKQIDGYTGAINLMADRYLLKLNHEAEKTALAGLKIGAEWAVKIIIAAIA
jgi:hypothetical protein